MYARRTVARPLLNWLPLLAWMALIYWLSDQPSLPHPAREYGISDYLFDYSAHAATYGILMLLGWRAATSRSSWLPTDIASFPFLASALFSAAYAFSDELHQSFVMGRSARFSDWLADVAGVLLATAAILVARTAIRRLGWLRRTPADDMDGGSGLTS